MAIKKTTYDQKRRPANTYNRVPINLYDSVKPENREIIKKLMKNKKMRKILANKK